MAISNNMQMNNPMMGMLAKAAVSTEPKFAPKTALQDANSSEEKAIAASTTLSKEISKGDKKSSVEDAGAEKRKKLIEKIAGFNKLNLSETQVGGMAAKIKQQLESGQNLIKHLLDSQGGDSMLQFAALKSLESSEDPNSEIGIKVAQYLEVMEIHKNKTITSWVNTSSSVAETTPDKDMAFQIQSMLSEASENSTSVRNLLSTIIHIGGEEHSDEVQQSSIKALAADIKAGTSSADIGVLAKTLGTLSNIASVSSMYKVADEQLAKLFKGDEVPSVSRSDYLEISLDISVNADPNTVTSYSIALLDSSPQSEYRFAESLKQTFSDFPENVWEDSNERQEAINSISSVMHSLSDPTRHAENKVKDMLFQQ